MYHMKRLSIEYINLFLSTTIIFFDGAQTHECLNDNQLIADVAGIAN